MIGWVWLVVAFIFGWLLGLICAFEISWRWQRTDFISIWPSKILDWKRMKNEN